MVWNKGKSVGQMKALTRDQVSLIKNLLDMKGNLRDLVLVSVAVDSMLRSIDLLALTVNDIVDGDGHVVSEFNILQQKTAKPVRVSLSTKTQKTLTQWIHHAGKSRNKYLFTGLRRSKDKAITHEQYRKLIKKWVQEIHLDPTLYSTHSLRRSKAALIYKETQNVEAIRMLLGQSSIAATSHYLGLEQQDALEISRKFEM